MNARRVRTPVSVSTVAIAHRSFAIRPLTRPIRISEYTIGAIANTVGISACTGPCTMPVGEIGAPLTATTTKRATWPAANSAMRPTAQRSGACGSSSRRRRASISGIDAAEKPPCTTEVI